MVHKPPHSLSSAAPGRAGHSRRAVAHVLALLAVSALLAPGRLAAGAGAGPEDAAFADPFTWAAPTPTAHPWTRWWWMGSAVDKTNLTHQLEMFKAAGIGGVE
ncbi:MAG TPA: hypothetical protein VN765_15215, partial [Candidatus Acidoferrum sp.]|nr:hypothetical protein [Candidatus Acidoferrum sp.]